MNFAREKNGLFVSLFSIKFKILEEKKNSFSKQTIREPHSSSLIHK